MDVIGGGASGRLRGPRSLGVNYLRQNLQILVDLPYDFGEGVDLLYGGASLGLKIAENHNLSLALSESEPKYTLKKIPGLRPIYFTVDVVDQFERRFTLPDGLLEAKFSTSFTLRRR
ncbi:hypothetical protein DFH06DRAFT_1128098 [Mycena polygramma]|nr:hypothetical protein DFH06DRAFT_1128098 [Mycena polygramma]